MIFWKYVARKKSAQVITSDGFALNQNKNLQIIFFFVKRQAKSTSWKISKTQ